MIHSFTVSAVNALNATLWSDHFDLYQTQIAAFRVGQSTEVVECEKKLQITRVTDNQLVKSLQSEAGRQTGHLSVI